MSLMYILIVVLIKYIGSTAFPKPIYLKHDAFISLIDADCKHTSASKPCFSLMGTCFEGYGEVDIADTVWSFHALPMFHAMGIVSISISVSSVFLFIKLPA